MKPLRVLAVAAILVAASSGAANIRIRGAYASPAPFWAAGLRLSDYGINALFVHSGSITKDMIARARSEGAEVYAEFPTLNGKGYVEKHPEAWPLNEKGEQAPAATWFLGACPTEPGFRAHRLTELRKLLDEHPVRGVWMDYFHWHAQFEEPEPILPETCFNESCLNRFARDTGTRLPAGSAAERARYILANHDRRWREWRENVLLEWAREIKAVVKAKRPEALLGVYHCPWTDEEYDGARERILGLDLQRLAAVVDVFSPMVYHGRMQRKPEWVGEYVTWLGRSLAATRNKVEIWPIVQAHGEPRAISAAEFERVMRAGAGGSSTGIMMFTFGSVVQDPAKLESLRRLYLNWR